eukprot:NODE_431_length_7570_cov_0.606263.p5 type:complete len:242 gc:universal NODE_431_length_7570_cov_0.606263:6019-5294(-)
MTGSGRFVNNRRIKAPQLDSGDDHTLPWNRDIFDQEIKSSLIEGIDVDEFGRRLYEKLEREYGDLSNNDFGIDHKVSLNTRRWKKGDPTTIVIKNRNHLLRILRNKGLALDSAAYVFLFEMLITIRKEYPIFYNIGSNFVFMSPAVVFIDAIGGGQWIISSTRGDDMYHGMPNYGTYNKPLTMTFKDWIDLVEKQINKKIIVGNEEHISVIPKVWNGNRGDKSGLVAMTAEQIEERSQWNQ